MSHTDREHALADPDLRWCHDAVQDVSRTFALTVDLLEEPMASQVCLGYLLCRVPDTVEDAAAIPPADQARLLRRYEQAIATGDPADAEAFVADLDPWLPPAEERSSDWAVTAAAPRILATFGRQPDAVRAAVRPHVSEMVEGMATFVERYADRGGLRIQTPAELSEYCHYVAGTVGGLITDLVCRRDVEAETERRLRDTAESFGQLLQRVNVAKDVHADFHEENNVYLPASHLEEYDIPQEALCEPEHHSETARVVRRTADDARTYLDDAQAYLEAVPEVAGNRVAAWATPFLLAVGTLRELERRPRDAVTGTGVKVTRAEVAAVVQATNGEFDDLATLRETVAERPLDRA